MVSKAWIGVGIIVIVVIAAIGAWYYWPKPKPPEEVVFNWVGTLEELSETNDPCAAMTTSSIWFMVNMYDPLFMPDPEQDNEPVPWVAESYTFSPDGLKCTVKIREGLKFHDGTEVTAEDVAFTMDRYLMMKKGYSHLWAGPVEPGTTEVIDTYTVRFDLKNPSATFIPSLTMFWVQNKDLILEHKEAGEFGEYGDLGQTWLAEETEMDVGSGPYMLTWYDRLEGMTLVKFEDYWKGWSPNQIDKINIVGIKEETTIKFAMERGDYDMTDDWMTPQTYKELEQVEGITVAWAPSAGVAGVFAINTQKPPVDDVHVRRAIAYCIDHEAAVSEIYGGVQARGIVPPTVPGFNEDIQPFTQNVTRALEELALSKYSVEELAAMEIEVRYLVDQEFDRLFAILLQSNAAEIGLNIKVLSWTFSTLTEAVKSPETTPHMFLGRTFTRFPDADYFLNFLHSNGAGTWRGAHWWLSNETDQLVEAQRAEVDPEERQVLLNQLQELFIENLPMIWIANPGTAVAMRDYVNGYRYSVDGYIFWFYRLTIEK